MTDLYTAATPYGHKVSTVLNNHDFAVFESGSIFVSQDPKGRSQAVQSLLTR